MATVFLGLGSNIGDRRASLDRALVLLGGRADIEVVKVSSYYETEPVGYADQPNFLNAAAMVRTALRPCELLEAAKAVEREMGRQRTIRWGPRVIDIDILLYDDERMDEEGLVIPHPEMMKRRFVLEPLAEIAPDLVLPDGRTAAQAAGVIRDA